MTTYLKVIIITIDWHCYLMYSSHFVAAVVVVKMVTGKPIIIITFNSTFIIVNWVIATMYYHYLHHSEYLFQISGFNCCYWRCLI